VVSADLAAALQTAMTAHMVDPSIGDGHGQLQWDYAVANGDVGYLNAGQAVTAVYSVAVADPFGAIAVETVTITLNGIDGDLFLISACRNRSDHARRAGFICPRVSRIAFARRASARHCSHHGSWTWLGYAEIFRSGLR
jgi:VCBS repeat-containing protein